MVMMACPAVPVKLEWGYHDAKRTGLKEKTCPHMNSRRLSLAATHSDWCASSLGTILMGAQVSTGQEWIENKLIVLIIQLVFNHKPAHIF